MTKILILTPDPKLPGGVNTYIKLLGKELDEKKIEKKFLVVGTTEWRFKNFIYYPLLILVQILKLNKILKDFHPSVVHINPSLTYTILIRDFLFLKIIKKRGYPVLFFIHGWQEQISKKFENLIFKNYFKNRFEMADAIVVLANQFKNKLVALGVSPLKIYVSSTMVESDMYITENKNFSHPFIVLFCAYMKKEKGPYELLNAVPLVLEKYSDTSFIFIGDGIELENLKRKTKEMGIEKNVIFTGYKTGKDKIEFFKKAHIFVFPSYSEGFPTVVLEAMAAGLPLIARLEGGLVDVIKDGKQGFVINEKIPDSKEIAEKIIQQIENPNLMKIMSKNNMNEGKKYDVKMVTERIIEIYNNICNKN